MIRVRVSNGGGLASIIMLALLSMAWSWPATADEPSTLERVPLEIHAGDERYRLEVELARTSAERQKGLMDRDHLDPEAGMLFLYQEAQPPQGGFWMYRTRIPLDIAFLDAEGRIAALHTMQPCTSHNPYDCPVTVAGVTYHAALEVNAGFFAARGIEEGACVSWPGRQSACRSAAE
ncbi:DUF192 domain-containing protein [Halomonas sp. MCCC 1A11036]|uniref:DUF192 domain-containing protein n=1 Tax=Billgrantia zhangzhouensis TaxID=2733481 RepID=A0ABS9AKH4_9GAMM|nr:DUF192 domain-containing protein [Halomonas zhangzhouensis]MCE8022260.1 DUF192 domain-containing protein [Halomonas zhangzhouensis]